MKWAPKLNHELRCEMEQCTKHAEGQFNGQETTLSPPSPFTTTPPNPLPTIEILDVSQRLDNPETLKSAVFQTNPHSDTANQLAASPQSC